MKSGAGGSAAMRGCIIRAQRPGAACPRAAVPGRISGRSGHVEGHVERGDRGEEGGAYGAAGRCVFCARLRRVLSVASGVHSDRARSTHAAIAVATPRPPGVTAGTGGGTFPGS